MNATIKDQPTPMLIVLVTIDQFRVLENNVNCHVRI